MQPRPPKTTLFPYTTLFRSAKDFAKKLMGKDIVTNSQAWKFLTNAKPETILFTAATDRKSTRLNSSHVAISYAVFCLKKKKKQCRRDQPPTNTAYSKTQRST